MALDQGLIASAHSDGTSVDAAQDVEFISSASVPGLTDNGLAQANQLNHDTGRQDPRQALDAVSALLRQGGAENLQLALRRAREQLSRCPDDPAWQLAIAYTEWTMRDGKAARASVTKLLSKHPDHIEGLHLMGLVETSQGEHTRAEQSYQRAHKLNPKSLPILLNYASSKVELKKFNEAEKLMHGLDPKTILESDFRSVLVRLRAAIAEGRGNPVQAHKILRLALAQWPSDAQIWERLHTISRAIDDFRTAVSALLALASLRPERRNQYMSKIASTLIDMDEPAAGLVVAHAINKVDPRYSDAWLAESFGRIVLTGGDSRSLLAIEQACRINPVRASFRQRAWVNFSLGRLDDGFRDYEARLGPENLVINPDPERLRGRDWDGSPLAGRTLLVWREQGLGDQIHFIRYLPALRRYVDRTGGGKILFLTDTALRRLFHNLPVDGLFVDIKQVPEFDVACPLTSLPHSMPGPIHPMDDTVPYLSVPNTEPASLWGSHSPDAKRRPRIGLAWSGNPANPRDKKRSIRLSWLHHLIGRDDALFYDLQILHARTDPDPRTVPNLIQRVREPVDLYDTAVALHEIDLVVSVDTALIHLCGAVGRSDWLLLPRSGDWRWRQQGDQNVWYPRLRIIRQVLPADWSDVIAMLHMQLSRYIADYNSAQQISHISGSIAR